MVQADPYALRYAASRLSAGANELRTQATRLLRRKAELVSNGWKGTASQSFDSQVEHQVSHLRKNADVLEHAATVLNSLATQMEHVVELRRQAKQYEIASWEYSGDSQDDLQHRQNLARQAAHYRQQADWEAKQADSLAAGQFHQIISMIPNVLSHGGHIVGRSGDLDDLPEPMRSYYRRHPELLEDDSNVEVASTSSWASVKEADERSLQQDAEVKASLLGLLKQLTQNERMGYWDESTDQQVFEQDYGDLSTDELKAQVFARLLKNQDQADRDEIAIMNEGISTGADFIPIVGNLKSLVEAVTGKDYITSHDLSWLERGFALAGVFVGGFGKVAGKVVKETSKEVADHIAKHADIPISDNISEGTVKVLDSVPSVRNGEFKKWFDSLSPDEFDKVWADPKLRELIKDRLRYPGGMHEWHLVARADIFKRWGVTAEQIAEMRTLISETKFVNPKGKHGGKGSTTAHNELLEIIDTSKDYAMFRRRLQSWADYRFEGGSEALPLGLRP
ncbi:pre-toxin TG domain-containing protein [Tumebacillus permanentifrigoris]|uniref:WXG100 family type VII secretion target n=1 Tax=Tumebacillus permanentifrigoris TaxID=378543 RepID=A0A316DAX7_9BACL|nr:pre-toxin TG domain-containing protein [Tumebacillus permanentifrigoris]PWK14252.1 WXG100 family type VII secretion target [Tumebacillus permanentifrigoris]